MQYENKLYALANKYQRLKTAFGALREEAAQTQRQCDTLTDQLRRMREMGVSGRRRSSVVSSLVAGPAPAAEAGAKPDGGLEAVAEGDESDGGDNAGEQIEGSSNGDDVVDGVSTPPAHAAAAADENAPEAATVGQDPSEEAGAHTQEVSELRARIEELEEQLAGALASMEAMAQAQRSSARRTSFQAERGAASAVIGDDNGDDDDDDDDGGRQEASGEQGRKEEMDGGPPMPPPEGPPLPLAPATSTAAATEAESGKAEGSPAEARLSDEEGVAGGREDSAAAGTGGCDAVEEESEGERGEAEGERRRSGGAAQATISSLLSQLADARERAEHAEEQLAAEQRRSEDLEKEVQQLKQKLVRVQAAAKFKDAILEKKMSALAEQERPSGAAPAPSSSSSSSSPSSSRPGGQGQGQHGRAHSGNSRAAASSAALTSAAAPPALSQRGAGGSGAAAQQKRSLVQKVFGGGVRHAGWLLKTSAAKKELIKSKRWRKRWCVIESGMMSYYESKDARAPKGTIQLASQGVDLTEKGHVQFTIAVEAGTKVYTFMSAEASHDEMRKDAKQWVDTLRAIIDAARDLGVSKTAGLAGGNLGGQGPVAASASVIPNPAFQTSSPDRRRRLSFGSRIGKSSALK